MKVAPGDVPFAKKSLGQHFLFDRDILSRIATSAGPVSGRTVVEVGPGPGGLTRALLDAGASPLIAVEMDDRFAAKLADWPEAAEGRLLIHHGDAREADIESLISSSGGTLPATVIANLPYNVATPLLVDWLKAGAWRGAMALMFQKEVALRICAAPDDQHYGRLAVLAGATSRARIAMSLPPGAFRPPPKVYSAVVVFEPLADNERFQDLAALETVAAAAFGQRRKMLRVALKAVSAAPSALLAAAGIDATRRAETLSQHEFRLLASAWRSLGGR